MNKPGCLLVMSLLPVSVYAQVESNNAVQLNAITVSADDAEESAAESGFEVNEIDVEAYMNTSTDVSQIISTSPGVMIREGGGLGADFKLSINGLSDKQIRYFVDGVPMENFGSALTLNNFPVNLVRGIEVYKGVTPIALAADALGGAINILTPAPDEEFLDVSYSYGSFNTHRLALMGQQSSGENYYFRVSSFFNHSDNDYRMDNVPRVDELGNKLGTMSVKRFHDEYTSRMLSVRGGVVDTGYADDLALTLTYADNKNEEQHPETSINQVFGGYHSINDTRLASITYHKSLGSFDLKAYLLTGVIKDSIFDTLSRDYRWDGSYIPHDNDGFGELGGPRSIFDRRDSITAANLYGKYWLDDDEAYLGLSLSTNQLDRSGNDRINENNTSFTHPNSVDKRVLAGEYGFRIMDESLNGSVFVKQYNYDARINAEQYLQNGTLTNVETLVGLSARGYGASTKYQVTESIHLKASYEKALRLPEPDEILGSGKYVRPNPALKHEESQNINFGIQHLLAKQAYRLTTTANFFYRDAKNFIRYVADQVIFGRYQNLDKVRIQGLEVATQLLAKQRHSLQFNVTWQDMTDRARHDAEGAANLNYGNRIPNTPYLFANLRVGSRFALEGGDSVSAYWSAHYVHKFYLQWEGSGDLDSKYFIPTQLTHDIDIDYALDHGTYNVSLSIRNLFDEAVYDNYDIQKPGRAFYLKVRYSY